MDQTVVSNTFLRRYNNGSWKTDGSDASRLALEATGGLNGSKGVRCNGYSDASGTIGFNFKKDLPDMGVTLKGSQVKALGMWIKNPTDADINVKLFIYKGAGFTNYADLKTFTLKPGWNYCQCGVSLGENETLYNFQIYMEYKSANLVYDNLCIYK